MPPETKQDWDELAKAVLDRRRALKLTQDLSVRGGPSELTIRKVERAETRAIRGLTKRQIEMALMWPEGTVDRILNGQVPDDELRELTGQPNGLTVAQARLYDAGLPAGGKTSIEVLADVNPAAAAGLQAVRAEGDRLRPAVDAMQAVMASTPGSGATPPAPAPADWPSTMRLGIDLLAMLQVAERTEATTALENTLRAWLAEQLGVDVQHVREMLGTA